MTTLRCLLLVERLGTTYCDGLEVTAEAADATVAGIDAVQSLAEEVVGLAGATAGGGGGPRW